MTAVDGTVETTVVGCAEGGGGCGGCCCGCGCGSCCLGAGCGGSSGFEAVFETLLEDVEGWDGDEDVERFEMRSFECEDALLWIHIYIYFRMKEFERVFWKGG
jgi:hypothetical protein